MDLLLPPEVASSLVKALIEAGSTETGGILMGEHVGPDIFRVKEITAQKKGGAFAAFVRFVEEITGPLMAFFQRTNCNYTRYNYLGEWHSHHSFVLVPSSCDHTTMLEMLADSQMGARFIVLMLVRLDGNNRLEHASFVYRRGVPPFVGRVVIERVHHGKSEMA